MIDRRVDISQSGKVWMVLAGLGVSFMFCGSSATRSRPAAFVPLLLLAAAFIAFFVAGRIAGDWRSGVYFFFVWLLFEDLIRKYMGNSMYIYFAKDVLVGVTYLALLVARSETRYGHALPAAVQIRVWGCSFFWGWCRFSIRFRRVLFYGLLGLKLYFYYVPLMFVGYAMLRKEDDLRRFLVVNMVLAAVISLVGILQAIVGLDFLNPHGGADIEELGHLVRYTPSGIAVLGPLRFL